LEQQIRFGHASAAAATLEATRRSTRIYWRLLGSRLLKLQFSGADGLRTYISFTASLL
jgi:hypothetical protein